MTNRGLHLACLSVVLLYLVTEGGKVFFNVWAPQRFVNACIWWFMIFLAYGLKNPWPLLYPIGSELNDLVVWANGGHMPVVGGPPVGDGRHVAATETSRLLWLADRSRFLWGAESSVGDVLIVLGLWAAAAQLSWVLLRPEPPRAPASPPQAHLPEPVELVHGRPHDARMMRDHAEESR